MKMTKAIEIQMGDRALFVETDETVEIPAGRILIAVPDKSRPDGAEPVVSIEEIERNFGEVKDVIITCCNNLYSAIESIPRPERFAVEFGVKLAGEAGIPMLTKASGEANFKVTVEWKKG
jgi:hypothetical protein